MLRTSPDSNASFSRWSFSASKSPAYDSFHEASRVQIGEARRSG